MELTSGAGGVNFPKNGLMMELRNTFGKAEGITDLRIYESKDMDLWIYGYGEIG